ncbi:MAG: hypothetical protein JWL63_3472 [Rhodocyclales bacterium]|nr:hypothetical protein [Rhodocyclales bacterium]
MFKQQAGSWVGVFVIFLIVYVIVSFIPFINMFTMLLMPVLMGGIMIACENQRVTGDLRIGDLFAGFERKLGPLAGLGLMTFVLMLIVMLLIALVAGLSILGAYATVQNFPKIMASLGVGTLMLMGLAAIIASMFVYAAVWYAPALIVLHDVPVFDAMKMSFNGSMKNILPGLVYGLSFIVWSILASLPVFLGWLILGPLVWTSAYVGYRDIYIQE